jgi:hypothetical protein
MIGPSMNAVFHMTIYAPPVEVKWRKEILCAEDWELWVD